MKMKRLARFDYLESEGAKTACEIPAEAEIVNITDRFREGGPIVISYVVRGDPETAEANRRRRETVIDSVLRSVVGREAGEVQ